jgi:hypothetical protein
MKNNKSNPNNQTDTTLEYLIINLIHQGVTFDELMKPTELIENEIDREEMKNKITNIILDSINQDYEYIDLLNQNSRAHKFLNNLGLDL